MCSVHELVLSKVASCCAHSQCICVTCVCVCVCVCTYRWAHVVLSVNIYVCRYVYVHMCVQTQVVDEPRRQRDSGDMSGPEWMIRHRMSDD